MKANTGRQIRRRLVKRVLGNVGVLAVTDPLKKRLRPLILMFVGQFLAERPGFLVAADLRKTLRQSVQDVFAVGELQGQVIQDGNSVLIALRSIEHERHAVVMFRRLFRHESPFLTPLLRQCFPGFCTKYTIRVVWIQNEVPGRLGHHPLATARNPTIPVPRRTSYQTRLEFTERTHHPLRFIKEAPC